MFLLDVYHWCVWLVHGTVSVMSERKPLMDEDKRKVLNLLEFCSEMRPDIPITELMWEVAGNEYIKDDEEFSGELQQYANCLIEDETERWKDHVATKGM